MGGTTLLYFGYLLSFKVAARVGRNVATLQQKIGKSYFHLGKLHFVSFFLVAIPKITNNAFPFCHSIFDPQAVRAHHVRHHDVCKKTVTNNCNLGWRRDFDIFGLAEILHDFGFTSGFLSFLELRTEAIPHQHCLL